MDQAKADIKSRTERKKDETRSKIVDTAIEMFRETGFDETTMEAVAERVDIAKGTLYNYFPTKEAILDEFIKRAFRRRNSERIQSLKELPGTRARMQLILGQLMEGVQAQPGLFERYIAYRMRNWVSFHRDASQDSGFYLLTAEIVLLGQASGEIRDDLPFDILKDLCEFVFMAVAKQYYMDPHGFDAGQAIDRGLDLFLDGAKKR